VTTVDTTSTVWVNPAGSVVPPPSSSSGNTNTLALGLGLGIGIPLALAVAGFGIWLCIQRERRKQPRPDDVPFPPSINGPAGPQLPVPPKPVATASRTPSLSSAPGTRELGSQDIRPELGETGLHPFPVEAPSSPTLVSGQHELHGMGRQTELPDQLRNLPPQYYQATISPGTPTGRDPWEMP
jgi:hypothetical protein